MSYYPSTYGAYQGQSQPYQSSHYPSQYPQTPVPTFSSFQHLPKPHYNPPSPVAAPTDRSAPELAGISPQVASQSIRQLVSGGLRDVGFGGAEPDAVRRLEFEVVAFVEKLYGRAHEYANLANRAGPIAKDLMLASEELGLQPKNLHKIKTSTKKKRKRAAMKIPTLAPPPSRSPSPDLLPSDDEGAPSVIPTTLRSVPLCFPKLPPKHTYLRTPASPLKKQALPSLEKKLKTAALVQGSLRNLLVATEDSSGQEDAELLGHIVNWEAVASPRKRWRF